MKKLLILIYIFLLTACQSEKIESDYEAIEISLEWLNEIDQKVIEFNNSSEIETSKKIEEQHESLLVNIYKKNSEGFYKIVVINSDKEYFDIKSEIYVDNDKILMEEWSGVSPLLYKKGKKKSDPCCTLFKRRVYFNDSLSGLTYLKQLKIKKFNSRESILNKLDKLPFEEIDRINIKNTYLLASKNLNKFIK